MKKKKVNQRLMLSKERISNLTGEFSEAIKGGQKPSRTSCNGCEPNSVVHTCNYSDLRTCTAATWSVFNNCETELC